MLPRRGKVRFSLTKGPSAFLTEFGNRVTNESLEKMVPFRKTQITLMHLIEHLANHSTYHPGQAALMTAAG
ncbi:MAG: hypothetical protein AUF67_14765 [Acidobacteria bacterium 13_1_20CM_58_21]|nr:MAG: hypothetical protein AUF67_14765 [Acidobacteria bacterium 13_1_20CM_58_21]